MESVEIWLWIIAGLFLVGIIVISSFKIINTYLTNEINNIIEKDLNEITNNINKMCSSPKYSKSSFLIKIPENVKLMYIYNGTIDGFGNIFCIEFDNKKYCQKSECNASMNTYEKELNEKWFSKILKRKKYNNFEFSINKDNKIFITYKELIS